MLNSLSVATERFRLDEYFLHFPGSGIFHHSVDLCGKMKHRPTAGPEAAIVFVGCPLVLVVQIYTSTAEPLERAHKVTSLLKMGLEGGGRTLSTCSSPTSAGSARSLLRKQVTAPASRHHMVTRPSRVALENPLP